MYSFKLLARPGELLFDHLKRVAEAMVWRFREDRPDLEIVLNPKDWENLVYILGFSHDFGKATCFFQDYLVADGAQQIRLRHQPETHHGLISAVFTYWLVKCYLTQHPSKSDHSLLRFLPFFWFLMVKKHHGNLADPLEEELFSRQFDYLNRQFAHVDQSELAAYIVFLGKTIQFNFDLNTIPTDLELYCQKELRSPFKGIRKIFERQYPAQTENYVLFQFFFSLLLQADKESVAFREMNRTRVAVDTNAVSRFKQENFGPPQNRMDELREAIFQDADAVIKVIDLNQKLFSLNVPTGTGKTLTSLAVALTLRKRIHQQRGIQSRIIYALPFTSIIDQNFDVFQKVFQEPGSDLLLKHHHLADVIYRPTINNGNEYDPGQAQFLTESWESEVVVTTFVQLFHTLLTNQNRALKKFHKFANAIILLDEVQSIPIKYWLLVRETFQALTKMLNTRIILITATQPRIFPQAHLVELVTEKAHYFRQLDRVNLHFEAEPMFLEPFIELLYNEIIKSSESFLVVLNTIASSIAVFNALKEKLARSDVKLFYLSTNIIPRDRLKRIQEIKNTPGRKIIISTQLIEAGVDLSVENVWRDFGPLDSINQVCGRCNRNFSGKTGKVRIFQLMNERGTAFYKFIYGDSVLSLVETREIFSGKQEFRENEFLENINRYYEQIEKKMSGAESEAIINQVRQLQFRTIAQFKLIDNADYIKQDLFVALNPTATALWERYQNLAILSKIERKVAFLKFRRQFSEYIISVPRRCFPPDFQDSIYLLEQKIVADFYDPETGFRQDSILPPISESLIL